MQLVWHKGKFWYCKQYHNDDNKPLSLLDMKDSSAGINVYGYKGFTHLCKDKKQYDAVRYFQEKGIAWYCRLYCPSN